MVASVEDNESELERISQKFGAFSIEDAEPLVLCNKSNILVDSKINSSLYEFQRRGVQFLYQSFANGSGAILNDVPCSGKKVQIIAFISALILSRKQHSPGVWRGLNSHPALIICPKNKIHVWENRIKEWSSLKTSVCSDLNISKATDSTDIVLFPFDLLAKSVVNVAKRKWTVLFLDNIEVITLKPKYELLLHHLPSILRFGISSKKLDNNESLAAIIGWVYPKYYEQLKMDRVKILSLIETFDKKTGAVADQIRGLHLKANLLSLRNEFFVKREGDIPEVLTSLSRDSDEEPFDCLPSASRNPAPRKNNKRKSSEKISPKSKSPRTNSKAVPSVSCDEFETVSNRGNQKKSIESIRRSTRKNDRSRTTYFEDTAGHLAQTNLKSTSKTYNKKIEPQPSCSTWFNREEDPTEDPSSSELTCSQNISDYNQIDDLLLSSNKVLQSPKKSKQRMPDAESFDSQSSSIFGDFETQQLALLDSLFLKTPEESKPAPSKFRSFTQASQKTRSKESNDSKLSAGVGGGGINQNLDNFSLETEKRKPLPRKLVETKTTCSSLKPDDLLDDLLFSQPAPRKAPPKRRYLTQSDSDLDAGVSSSRQPMQFITNLEQDSQFF